MSKMNWFGKKSGDGDGDGDGEKKKRSKAKAKFLHSVVIDKPLPASQDMVLDGEFHGLHNPLAWENMPPVLQEKFPHWKNSSPSLKSPGTAPAKDRLAISAEQTFQISTNFKPPANTIPYVVMECDNLNSIALKFDRTPSEIARLNRKPLGLTFSLFPGEVLYVPDPNYVPPSPPTPSLLSPPSGTLTESHKTLKSSSASDESGEEREQQSSVQEGSSPEEPQFTVIAKYMSEDQGCANGNLLLSNRALMFQPQDSDPLVVELGRATFEITIPLDDIAYAALTKDYTPPWRKSPLMRGTVQSDSTVTEENRGQQPQAGPSDRHSNGVTSDAKEASPPSSGDSGASEEGEKVVLSAEGVKFVIAGGEELESEDSQTNFQSEEQQQQQPPETNSNSEMEINDLHSTEIFDVKQEQSVSDNSEELLQIMGATVPSGDRQNSESAESSVSTESLLAEQPNFLHIRISSKSSVTYLYTPISEIGIKIPGKSRRSTSPVQHIKRAFCFAVPEARIDELVSFLTSQHSQARMGVGSPLDPRSWSGGSFEFITSLDVREDEELRFSDNHFDPDSWEIYSLQDFSKFRPKIAKMEVEQSLPLPTLVEESDLLEESHLKNLTPHLPSRAVSRDWYLVYSTFKHGISLRTLYRNMVDFEDSPTLLIVRDDCNKLFGAVVSCRLRISDHFYGTGESFLFSFEESGFRIYHWSGRNNYIVKGNSDSMSIGSEDGHFGLWLDESFYHGSSYPCSTFNNKCLASQEDFVCSGVEAWGFL